jgi:hypothetical protein
MTVRADPKIEIYGDWMNSWPRRLASLHELVERRVGLVWNQTPAFPAVGNPFPYVTHDGDPRVVYLGSDAHIHELRLQGGWYQADLSAIVTDSPPAVPAGSTPFAHFGSDGIARVLYLGAN